MVNQERGGIVSFVVVGVVLAGLLAGALYFSKQQGREARNNSPVAEVAERNPEPEAAPEEAPAAESRNEQTEQAGSNGQNTAQNPAPTNNRQAGGGTVQTPDTTDRVATTGPSDIPSTGPAETAVVVAGLAGLTFAASRHFLARRHLRQSALRK